MSRLPIVVLGLLVTVLRGIASSSVSSRTQTATYVTHVGFGTRASLRALSPCGRVTALGSLVLDLGSTRLAAIGVCLRAVKVFGFGVANLQGK